jgi:hypothetical protein
MKKYISLILAILLSAGLAACGSTGDPAEPAPEIAEAEVEKIEMQLEYNEKAQVRGFIQAFTSDGSLVWEHTTNTCGVGQVDTIQEIGLGPAGYLFLEEGSIYCLDPDTGEMLWKNEDFGGAGASWGFDDAGNLYLTGYFEPWLFGVDRSGKTLADYRTMPTYYEEAGFYWPASLSVEDDGTVHIRYHSNDRILGIDPSAGAVIDNRQYAEPLDAEFLVGEWADNEVSPTVRLVVSDNLEFEFFLNVDSETSYCYEGRFILDILNEEYSKEPDWLCSELVYTDDPVIGAIGGIGNFIVTYSSRGGYGDDCFCLTQVNDGYSFLSINLDVCDVMLYRVPQSAGGPVG